MNDNAINADMVEVPISDEAYEMLVKLAADAGMELQEFINKRLFVVDTKPPTTSE